MQQLIVMSLLAPYLVLVITPCESPRGTNKLSVAVNEEDQHISHHGEFLDDTYFNIQSSELESQENFYGAGSDSNKQDKYDYDGDDTTYFRYISSQLSERYFDTNEQKKIVYSDTSNVNKFEYNPINEKLNQTWWENESQKTPSREDNLSFGETPSFGLTSRSDFNNDQIVSLNEMELNRKTSALNQSKLSAEEELDGTSLKIPPLEIVNREDLRSTFPETDSQELYYRNFVSTHRPYIYSNVSERFYNGNEPMKNMYIKPMKGQVIYNDLRKIQYEEHSLNDARLLDSSYLSDETSESTISENVGKENDENKIFVPDFLNQPMKGDSNDTSNNTFPLDYSNFDYHVWESSREKTPESIENEQYEDGPVNTLPIEILLDILPKSSYEINLEEYNVLKRFFRGNTIEIILTPSFNFSAYPTKGELLKAIMIKIIDSEIAKQNPYLIKCLNLFLNQVPLDGDGANPVSVEFRRFKTAFDIAEALGAVDLLKIRENNLVKPLTRVVRWLNNKFEPETHIGYWKVPLRYITKADFLLSFFGALLKNENVSESLKNDIKEISTCIFNEGKGAEKMLYDVM